MQVLILPGYVRIVGTKMNDGLEQNKYFVARTKDPAGKHTGCFMFVLDIDHDIHARTALTAYALSCRDSYPKLADALMNRLHTVETQLELFTLGE